MLRGWIARIVGSERGVRRLLIACMAIGFGALIVTAAMATWLIGQNATAAEQVAHTYEVELAINRTRTVIEQSETTRRGYLLTGNRVYRDAYITASRRIAGELDVVGRLTADNPGQRARLAMLRERVGELVAVRNQSLRRVDAGQLGAAIAAFGQEAGAQRLRAIRETFDAMTAEEQRLLTQRDRQLDDSVRAFLWVLALAGVLVGLVAIASLLTLLRYTRDLNRTSARLAVLNENLEDEVSIRTADLKRANEEVQRFAYIVSHDLRSPLVNVMGFTAELEAATKTIAGLVEQVRTSHPDAVTREAELAATEDLPEAIGFIRAATAKMDRLINAILKLSREGRRVLSPEPIDMTALAGGIRDSLAHVAEEKGVTIAIEPLPGLRADRVAIEQIFSNLIENATKYLEPGRPGRVTVAGRRAGARAVYTVADNGRGIDPRDHARIFDLFRRSGRQDTAGEGIGLAHARALAIRLGGMIEVQSTLGEGATFEVSLPVEPGDFQEDKP